MSIAASGRYSRYSQSLLGLRFRPSRAKLRSTIQVRPVTRKACCFRLTVCRLQPSCRFSARAGFVSVRAGRLIWPVALAPVIPPAQAGTVSQGMQCAGCGSAAVTDRPERTAKG